jgi:putative DNA primase/helicase
VVLYLFFTYSIEAFDIAPILGIESPTHRCGKTTLAKLIGRLCFHQLNCSNITGPALFRAIEKWHPTILIDEADSFLTDPQNNDIRGMINSGHEREFAFVVRAGSKDDDHEPRKFSTWCAKVVALIGKLPTTIDDRTIKIRLERKTAKDEVHRLRRHHLNALRPFQRQFARWTADHLEALRAEREPYEVERLDDRALDNWDVLLHIATLLGGEWPERARQAALALSASRVDETIGVELLSDINRIFTQQQVTKMYTEMLVANLTSDDERPWATWRRGKPIDARGLARLLRPFDVYPGTVRIGGTTGKGYTLEQGDGKPSKLAEAIDRYVPPPPLL